MKVLHVTMGINPSSGGPTRSVKGLCRALACAGIETTLLVLEGNSEFENPCGVKVIYETLPDVRAYDIVHLHGLWHPKLHAVVVACRKANVKYVFSPRGMLDPWALSVKKWKKKLALLVYQRADLRHAAMFHATASAEAEHIRQAGFSQPCVISPNAVDIPLRLPSHETKDANVKTALFLSRLHQGKGLLMLADAWSQVRPQGWVMRVVGPDSYGHKAEVLAKIRSLGIEGDWQFRDMVDDDEKWREYVMADLLVHPSVSENFGITIAEGMAAGLPIICTKGAPWQDIEKYKCGWWINIGVEPLSKALIEAMSLTDNERREMGKRGRKLVEEKYTWDAVVKIMMEGYEEVLHG